VGLGRDDVDLLRPFFDGLTVEVGDADLENLSFILISMGMLLVTVNCLALLLLPPPLLAFPSPGILGEEEELLRRYGKDYEDYMKKTWGFSPRSGDKTASSAAI